MHARVLGAGRAGGPAGRTGASRKRRTSAMQVLRDLSVGVFYWIGEDAAATVREIAELGVEVCQLAVVGERKLTPALAAAYRQALAAAELDVETIFAAYEGESYADIPTVMRSVGFMPPATRAARELRTREVIDFGAALGIRSFGCHIGFVPEEANADYAEVREVVRRSADYAASCGMTFCLETGQEPAPLLLEFLKDVERAARGAHLRPGEHGAVGGRGAYRGVPAAARARGFDPRQGRRLAGSRHSRRTGAGAAARRRRGEDCAGRTHPSQERIYGHDQRRSGRARRRTARRDAEKRRRSAKASARLLKPARRPTV